jgi:hypothetical protein
MACWSFLEILAENVFDPTGSIKRYQFFSPNYQSSNYMSNQVPSESARFAAHGAHKGFLPGVLSHVVTNVRRFGQRITANLAKVESRVQQCVTASPSLGSRTPRSDGIYVPSF